MNVALASPARFTAPAHQFCCTPPPYDLPWITPDRRDIEAAIQLDDVDALVLALQCSSRNTCGSDPVHQAVSCKHPGALEFLLRRGYSAEGQGGVKLLRTLVRAGFTSQTSDEYKMAELLLQHGIKPDDSEADAGMEGDGCVSLLGLAALRQCVLGTELLLLYGADPNRSGQHGKTALHAVCEAVCCFQPLGMLPMYPEIQGLGSFAEMLDVDVLSLPSLQGAFDNVFDDNMPLEAPPLHSLVGELALPTLWDVLNSRGYLSSLQNPTLLQTSVKDGSNPEIRTVNSELVPRDTKGPLSKTSHILELLLRQGADAGARDDSGQRPADRLPPYAIQLRAKLQRAEEGPAPETGFRPCLLAAPEINCPNRSSARR
eukprot:TRINITY_DN24179_c0_g1_i1.p1 TRINITY_DN24179_c0_g1~~TRINITY_DN24179_c0_g1_i1.p1  ORF type:complete len:373 (-),score=49.64 TRINITY_DN24179_c0_g1_i1:95-1213(-)